MDKVIIKDLLVRGVIGIHEWEREKPQDILCGGIFPSYFRSNLKDLKKYSFLSVGCFVGLCPPRNDVGSNVIH